MANKQSTLIVDCRVLQTRAWSRGMGRYMTALIGGIYQQKSIPRVVLIFSDKPELIEERQPVLKKIAPSAECYFLPFQDGLSEKVRKENNATIDKFIQDQEFEGAAFLSGSIFSFDYAPVFPTKTYNTCIFYDMIPLKWWRIFYAYFPRDEYFKRFRHVYECQAVFTISESVKKDLVTILGIQPEKVVNIAGASIPGLTEDKGIQQSGIEAVPGYRYVLLPGGDSPHKNMLRAIRAFDECNAIFGDTLRLIVTSYYSESNIQRMKQVSPNIILAGDVAESYLRILYQNADAVLFPSLDEGLGLPVLEAIDNDRKVVCSSIPVFREISDDAMYFFDPYDIESMKQSLINALVGRSWAHKHRYYTRIKGKYTWKNSAERLLSSLWVESASNSHPINFGRGKLKLVIEQTNGLGGIQRVGAIVAQQASLDGITLYIDTLKEGRSQAYHVPFIFKYFIPCFDISDAPVKSKKVKTKVVLTEESEMSIPVGIALGAEFVGTESDLQRAISKLGTEFNVPEFASKALNKQVRLPQP